MNAYIRWVNENPGGPRDEAGNWHSYERRFAIRPNYRHTVNPDSYTVKDYLFLEGSGRPTQAKFDTVREAKDWAEHRITARSHLEHPTPRPQPPTSGPLGSLAGRKE